MTFWLISGLTAATLFALAWWTSGRTNPTRRPIDPTHHLPTQEAAARAASYHPGTPPTTGARW